MWLCGCVWYVCCYGRIIFSSVFAIAESMDMDMYEVPCCCLPISMTLTRGGGGSPIFLLVVHQPASPSIWSAVQSLRRCKWINLSCVLRVCEIIHNMFGCDCYVVVECYGGIECGWRCSV